MDKARDNKDDLKMRLLKGSYVSPCIMSFAAGFLGDIDKAFDWFEKAYDEHDAYLCSIKYYPWLPIKIRQDSRFNSFSIRIS